VSRQTKEVYTTGLPNFRRHKRNKHRGRCMGQGNPSALRLDFKSRLITKDSTSPIMKHTNTNLSMPSIEHHLCFINKNKATQRNETQDRDTCKRRDTCKGRDSRHMQTGRVYLHLCVPTLNRLFLGRACLLKHDC